MVGQQGPVAWLRLTVMHETDYHDSQARHVSPVQNAAFDVIGVFGFGKDFKATLDLHGEGAQACKCLSDGMGYPHALHRNIRRPVRAESM